MTVWNSEVASYTSQCPHYLTRCLDHSRHSGWMNGFILPPLPLPLNGSSSLHCLPNCHIHFSETYRWPSVPKLSVASLRPEVQPLRAPGIWSPPPCSYSLTDTWRVRDSGYSLLLQQVPSFCHLRGLNQSMNFSKFLSFLRATLKVWPFRSPPWPQSV